MPETVATCPLCNSPENHPFEQRLDHGQQIVYRICRGCGLVFQSPRMTVSESDLFYERQYRTLYQGQEGPDRKDLAIQRGRAEAMARFSRQHGLTHIARHLDIGCSAGLALRQFAKEFGSQPVGVEPGDAYRDYAAQQGMRVYASLEDLLAAGEPPFDLISLSHVLEHLPDPASYLTMLREKWLQPDGRLLLEVPNLYAHESFEVAHVLAFSPHTLAQTVQQAGFAVHASQTHGKPRSRLVPLYISLLARPINGGQTPALVPETGVRFQRRLGLLRRSLLTRLLPRLAWVPLEEI